MVTIKVSVLFSPKFNESLIKLSNITLDTIDETILLAKMIKLLQEEYKIIIKIRDDLYKNYEVIGFENDIIKLKDSDKIDDFSEKINELSNKDIELLTKEKFKVTKSMAKVLTAQDLLNLESILSY